MRLPKSRGVLSAALVQALSNSETDVRWPEAEHGEDAALALWVLYELSYKGFDEVDDAAEWDPNLLGLRHSLESDLERELRARYGGRTPEHDDLGEDLFAMVEADEGASVARFVQTEADEEQARELLRLRSVYHLKESDPVAFVVPRLPLRAKAALMELQYDEYGGGDPNRLHHQLFARGLEGAGLRAEYGAYVDEVPLEVLEQNNAMSLFGLHRRLRAAAMGHLAAFEATSSVPSRRMAQGFERLGLGGAIVDYYREHVMADSVHDQLAARVICGTLVEDEPHLRDDVYFGAFTCLDLEDRFARYLLSRWEEAS